MDRLTDEELVSLWADQSNDSSYRQRALDELFQRYQTKVALWCYRFAGDRDRAADLAQEVFVRLLLNLSQFRGDSKFSTWLYTITRNHCFNASRLRGGREEQSLEFMDIADMQTRGPDREAELASEVRHMRELLNDTLDKTEREVMTLHFGEELSLQTITGLLALSNSSGAKAYIVSARRKLSAALARRSRQRQPSGSARNE